MKIVLVQHQLINDRHSEYTSNTSSFVAMHYRGITGVQVPTYLGTLFFINYASTFLQSPAPGP